MKKTLKKIYILIFPVFYLMLMLYYQYIRYDILTFISQHNYLLTITWVFIGLGIMTSFGMECCWWIKIIGRWISSV